MLRPFALAALVLSCGGSNVPVCPAVAGPAPAAHDAGPPQAPVATPGSPAWSDAESPIPVDSDDPIWGNRDAPVTVVAFGDFYCDFSAHAAATLASLRVRYGGKQIRIVWKDAPMPYHPHAMAAAEAARGVFELAGNDSFWRFHDLLFAKQIFSDPSPLAAEVFVALAMEAGLRDRAEYRRGLDDHRWAKRVQSSMALSKRLAFGLSPYWFINGVGISGMEQADRSVAWISYELDEGARLIRQGTPADHVYVHRSKQNHTNPPAAFPGAGPDDDHDVWPVPVAGAPTLGPPTALVTIAVFADFQCPFSARVQPTLRRVRDTYGEKVRIVFRHQSSHDSSEPASELAMFAFKQKGAAGFWLVHDKLFLLDRPADDRALERIAREAGLSPARAMAAVRAHQYRNVVVDDASLADDVNAAVTPHFFINGRRLVGPQPFESFKALIDEQLAAAEARVARGVAPRSIYADIMKTAREPLWPQHRDVALPNRPLPSRGDPDAKVVIQEFGDFACHYCAWGESAVEQALKRYGTRIRLVYRNLPMQQFGQQAAEAAQEAFEQKGDAGFWAVHDLLLRSPTKLAAADLETHAAAAGLDLTRFRSALASGTHRKTIDVDVQAARTADIAITPAYVVNGYVIRGVAPTAKLNKVIDRALREVR